MPLKDHSHSLNHTARDAYLGQKQRERNHHEAVSRSTTPLHRSNGSQTRRDSDANIDKEVTNALAARDIVPLQPDNKSKALAMKMLIPNTIDSIAGVTASKGHPTANIQKLEEKMQESRGKTQQAKQAAEQQLSLEDTRSLSFLDDNDPYHDDENHTMVFRGNQAQLSQPQPRRINHSEYSRNVRSATTGLPNFGANSGSNWLAELRDEREHEEKAGFASFQSKETAAQKIHSAGSEVKPAEDQINETLETPSRVQTIPPARGTQPIIKAVSFDSPGVNSRELARADSPELEIPRRHPSKTSVSGARKIARPLETITRTSTVQHADAAQDANRTPFAKPSLYRQPLQGKPSNDLNRQGTLESSRASDYPTSSDDEALPTLAKAIAPVMVSSNEVDRKRPREDDVDYDLATLKSMRYENLVVEDFSKDPRNTVPNHAFDSQGNAMTLSQRLGNLSKMTEEEQKNMFRNQDDNEWAQIGSWFIERFQEDLQRLVNLRTERRKISLRYEDEIRRRQREVEASLSGVDDELKDLRRGGGELIKGRDVSSRRGTPQR